MRSEGGRGEVCISLIVTGPAQSRCPKDVYITMGFIYTTDISNVGKCVFAKNKVMYIGSKIYLQFLIAYSNICL